MLRIVSLMLTTASVMLAGSVNEDLLEAARNGDLAQVQNLLAKGAELETKTSYGQTPLYLAAMNGQQKVVEFLLEKGAKSDIRDTFYKAPMFAFVLMRKHYDVAKLLITKGNGPLDNYLDAAAGSGNADLVRAVLEKGKPSQSSLDKAYELALDRKQTEVADALKRAGAQPPAPPAQVDIKVLEAYAGTYKSQEFPVDIKVSVKEGKLYMQATGQGEFAPKPKSATVFEFAPARLEVEFDSSASFTLKQGGTTRKFRKALSQ